MSFMLKHKMQSPGWVLARLPNALSYTDIYFFGHVVDVVLVEAHDAVPGLGVPQAPQRFILNRNLFFFYELQVAGHVVDVVLVEAHDAVPRLGVRQAPQRFILNRNLFFFMNSRLRDTL